MPILNFNKKFSGKVRNGRKHHTIRAFRKFPIKPGDTLYLYTGLRTKYAKRLRIVTCSAIHLIKIRKSSIEITICGTSGAVGMQKVWGAARDNFAKSDGFTGWAEMKEWWLKVPGLPFTGQLICW